MPIAVRSSPSSFLLLGCFAACGASGAQRDAPGERDGVAVAGDAGLADVPAADTGREDLRPSPADTAQDLPQEGATEAVDSPSGATDAPRDPREVGALDAAVADSSTGGADAAADSAGRDLAGPRPATCGGRRTNLSEDPANCGACGTVCPDYCSDGVCAAGCAPPLFSSTGGVCLDPQTAPGNCGANGAWAGAACWDNQLCQAGECVSMCKANETYCAGVCADLLSSNSHCGSCGGACAAGTGCMLGGCVPCSSLLPMLPQVAAQSPSRVLAADLNHDGKLDLLTTSSAIGVFLGNGDGTFAPERRNTAVAYPYAAALGDLDGDGNLDLVVTAGWSAGGVTVLPGLADGTFGAPRTYPLPQSGEVTLADLNRDGRLDVVVTGGSDKVVYVFLGKTGGELSAVTSVDSDDVADKLATGDLDGDGVLDLVVTEPNSGYVRILLGVGDGTFAHPVGFTAGLGIRDVAVADVNADGKMDILLVVNSSLGVHYGTGQAELGGRSSGGGVGTATSPILLRDLDGDDRLDVLVGGSQSGAEVAILLSRNYGNDLRPAFALGSGDARWAATGDFNQDGKVDIVTADGSAGTLSVFLGRGTGRFVQPSLRELDNSPESVTFTDLDADGLPDLVIASSGVRLVYVFRGKDQYGTGSSWTIPDDAGTVTAVADLDGDGQGDFVFGNSRKKVMAFLLSGNGYHSARTYAFERLVSALVLGDWNGDGKIDLATANADTNDVTVVLGQGGDRIGQATHYPVGTAPKQIFALDLDGDGRLDLVTADTGSGSLSILPGVGDGTFGTRKTLATGGAKWVEWADFDGNGVVDLAVLGARDAATGGQAFGVLLGSGGGAFAPAKTYPYDGIVDSFSAGDLDGDGHVDLLLPDVRNHSMRYRLGVGDGTFGPPSAPYLLPVISGTARLFDLNRDGVADVVILDSTSSGGFGILYGVKGCHSGY